MLICKETLSIRVKISFSLLVLFVFWRGRVPGVEVSCTKKLAGASDVAKGFEFHFNYNNMEGF